MIWFLISSSLILSIVGGAIIYSLLPDVNYLSTVLGLFLLSVGLFMLNAIDRFESYKFKDKNDYINRQ